MDPTSQPPRRSTRKFRPRGPSTPSPKPNPPVSNTKQEEEDNSKAAKQIANRLAIGKAKPETVTTAAPEVAFHATASSVGIRSFGVGSSEPSSSTVVSSASPRKDEDEVLPAVSSVTPQKDEEEDRTLVTRTKEEYVEPWDYESSYYPTVLPLREPNSGDPDICDQEEFGVLAKHPEYDEKNINSANELGLTSHQQGEKQMILFKFPDTLPIMKQSTGSKGKPFESLPECFMGKMLVYKSGAVKMKLGGATFDVSPGPKTKFDSDVAAVDTKGKKCTRFGSSTKFATVTPDVESLLNSTAGMEIHK